MHSNICPTVIRASGPKSPGGREPYSNGQTACGVMAHWAATPVEQGAQVIEHPRSPKITIYFDVCLKKD